MPVRNDIAGISREKNATQMPAISWQITALVKQVLVDDPAHEERQAADAGARVGEMSLDLVVSNVVQLLRHGHEETDDVGEGVGQVEGEERRPVRNVHEERLPKDGRVA